MRTKGSFRTLPKKNLIEETEGRRLLLVLGRSQSQIARDLNALGVPAQQRSAWGWVHGRARPEAFMRAVLQRLYGIPVETWMSDAERALMANVDAVMNSVADPPSPPGHPSTRRPRRTEFPT